MNCNEKDRAWAIAGLVVFLLMVLVFSWVSVYRTGYQAAYTDYKDSNIDRPENIDYLITYEKNLIDKKYRRD